MANYSIKLGLQKLKGAFLTNLKGKTATKKCLCIPIEENHLFVGEKDTYLDLSVIELKDSKYGDSHCIRQTFPKDLYEKMSDDEKKLIPILGNMREMKAATQEIKTVAEPEDDLPF